jgi:hypothetical protein
LDGGKDALTVFRDQDKKGMSGRFLNQLQDGIGPFCFHLVGFENATDNLPILIGFKDKAIEELPEQVDGDVGEAFAPVRFKPYPIRMDTLTNPPAIPAGATGAKRAFPGLAKDGLADTNGGLALSRPDRTMNEQRVVKPAALAGQPGDFFGNAVMCWKQTPGHGR